jgi:hypothetical protein
MVLVAIGYYFRFDFFKPPTSLTTESKSTTINSELKPVYVGNYDVVVKLATDSLCNSDSSLSHCKSEIYLKDLNTGKETYVLTTDDVVSQNDSRVPQYRDGYIFLVKRVGDDTYPSENWTDQLWVYVDQSNGQKIADSKGLVFNVNQDGSLVGLLFYEGESPATNSASIAFREDDWQVKQFALAQTKCTDLDSSGILNLQTWQADPPVLWGGYTSGVGVINCFWSINPSTAEVQYFATSPQAYFLLYPEKKVALYTDKPTFLDVDSHQLWLDQHKRYGLYLYNLLTKQITQIASLPADFESIQPDWISVDTLKYNTSTGSATYILP